MTWSSDEPQETLTEETPESEPEATQPDPSELLMARIKQLESALREAQQDVLRAQAEAQTVIRRQRSQFDEERKYASRSLIEDLLPVLDNFERSLGSLEKGANPDKVREGIVSIEKMLRRALENAGLSLVPTEGMQLNPELHEAIATEPNEEMPEESITTVLEPGYQLHDRVLRPAKVRVTVKP
ncbi:MAG: nucleotide exchange factor GrpE [Fimbriimonadaceae bacterium]|nr:nucleotide exchange factor GrpE [Fimbriimonadaceae bacterium]